MLACRTGDPRSTRRPRSLALRPDLGPGLLLPSPRPSCPRLGPCSLAPRGRAAGAGVISALATGLRAGRGQSPGLWRQRAAAGWPRGAGGDRARRPEVGGGGGAARRGAARPGAGSCPGNGALPRGGPCPAAGENFWGKPGGLSSGGALSRVRSLSWDGALSGDGILSTLRMVRAEIDQKSKIA